MVVVVGGMGGRVGRGYDPAEFAHLQVLLDARTRLTVGMLRAAATVAIAAVTVLLLLLRRVELLAQRVARTCYYEPDAVLLWLKTGRGGETRAFEQGLRRRRSRRARFQV